MGTMRKFCVFFFSSFVVLMTLRVYNYRPKTLDLLADTTVDGTMVPLYGVRENIEARAEEKEIEDDGEFKEENPEVTSKDEETLIEDE